ncbi:hypothetical protein HDC33_000203 [Sporosarcina sp. JAI121]|nr:hypothetical protein [Sporosarcina sp. JAI121]
MVYNSIGKVNFFFERNTGVTACCGGDGVSW